jgi:hypothetical protein
MTDYFGGARALALEDEGSVQQTQAPAAVDYFSGARGLDMPQQAAPVAPEAPSPLGVNFDRPKSQVRADIARLPEADRPRAMREWADRFVAKERQGGGHGASDFVRNFARGTPVGSWLDEANAATSAGLHKITGGYAGSPYDEAIAYQRATDRAVDKESSKIAGPVTAGDLTKVAGGIASVRLAPVATIFRGATMLPQVGNALATGLGYGALYGAGQGEDTTSNRLWEASKGAALGGGLGVAAVPVARGLGNAVGYVADQFRRTPQALRGYERGAVNALARSTTDDALAGQYQQRVAELGPEGMLADMGMNLRGQAGAIANQPGSGQRQIMTALDARRQGAAGRIGQDVDQALGPAANIPETVNATQQYYRQQALPHRQQFQQNPVPFTQQLDDTLQLLAQNEPAVIRSAERLAAMDNQSGPQQWFARQMPNGQYQIERVPNASEWDYIKRALDDMGRSPEANLRRIYGGLAARVRGQVDEALSPGAPQDSPWARARRLEAEDFQIRDAVEQGRGAFNRSLTPDQMRAELYGVGQPPQGGMTPPQIAGYGVGARDQVRTIMGNAATAHGENAATGARKALGSDYAREKLDIIAGPQAAGQLTRRLDAETVFDQTRQGVLGGSPTAPRLAAQAEFPNPAARQDAISDVGKKSLGGMAAEASLRLANALSGNALNERRARIAADAAEMLVAQGHARDNVANAIFAYSQSRALSTQQRRAIARLAITIAEGGRQKAIEAVGP